MRTEKESQLLLVEADADVREVVTELLEYAGWRVVQTRGAVEAAARLESATWDALLAHLGAVADSDLLRRARALNPRMRIVLMTAGSAVPVPPEADALLQKPFSARRLQDALPQPRLHKQG